MKMKKIILPIIAILFLAIFGVVGFFGYRFLTESNQVADTINHNQELTLKVRNNLALAIQPLDEFETINADEPQFELVSNTLSQVEKNLKELETIIQKEGENLKTLDDNQDVEKIYTLQKEYFEKASQVNQNLLTSVQSLICVTNNFYEIEGTQNEVENLVEKIEGSDDDEEIMIETLNKLGNSFKQVYEQLNQQEKCFEDPRIKEIYNRESVQTGKIDTATAFRDLSNLYIGLANAVKADDTMQAENIADTIGVILDSPSVTSLDDQYNEILEILFSDLEENLNEWNQTVDKIDNEINTIASKYGLQVVELE